MLFKTLTMCLIMILLTTPAIAAIETFTASTEYVVGDYETLDIAKKRAMEKARQDVIEQTGVYMKNYTRMENMQVSEDIIDVISNDAIEIISHNYKINISPNGDTIVHATITANVDTQNIYQLLNEQQTTQVARAQKNAMLQTEKKLLDKSSEELQSKISSIENNLDSELGIADEQERQVREFLAWEKIREATSDDIDKNINLYKEALLSNPKSSAAYTNLGKMYAEKKDYQNAIKLYHKALYLNPREVYAWSNLGLVAQELQKYDSAIEFFKKAWELDPRNPIIYAGRADVYKAQKQYDKALADYTQSLNLRPDVWVYMLRGDIYETVGKPSLALQDYTKAIELNPNNTSAHLMRGFLYDNMKSYDAALKDYTRALELTVQNPNVKLSPFNASDIYVYRGGAYAAANQNHLAIADYSQALTINPKNVDAYYWRGRSFMAMDDYARAIVDFTTVLHINPSYEDGDAYFNRGNAYAYQGNYDAAIADYKQGLLLNPQNEKAKANLQVIQSYKK